MILKELMTVMETIAPEALAEEWDNVGLLVGDASRELDTVVVTLDADEAAIRFAKEQGAQAIVAHHPLIFSPVRAVCAPSALYTLAASGIACFAAHTNLDAAKGGVNDVLAAKIGLTDVCEAFGGIGRIGRLSQEMTPEGFATFVGQTLGTRVQLRKGIKTIRTVALVGGAGGDFIADCEADAYLTGEIKHHEWLETPAHLTVVAAGHYATEVVVVEPLANRLQKSCPALRVVPFTGHAPYTTV